MTIKEPGFYRLTEEIKVRNLTTIATLPKGTVIEITQVSKRWQQVIGPALLDWMHWNLPVEKVEA